MSLDSTKVRTGVSGEVSVGPTASAAPATTAAVLTGFSGLGYVGEDGVTESPSKTTKSLKGWQNADTVRTVVTDAELKFTFLLIETSKATLELYYGTTATSAATEGSINIVPSNTGGRKSFVVDVVDGAELSRTYIGSGEVTETGDIVYKNGEPIGYPITITAYPVAGVSAKKMTTALKT